MENLWASLPAGVTNAIIVVVVMAVIWIAIKLVFNIARRVLALGCFVILLIGALLLTSRFLGI